MDLSYILNQLGEERSGYFNSVSPPLIQTSNFAFPTVQKLRDALSDEYRHLLYSRGNNPTVDLARKKLAALDGAGDALLLSSGVAAIFLAVFAHVKAGDHIVSVKNPYSWTGKLFSVLLPRFGITTTMVDGREAGNFEQAIRPNTRVIYLESPNTLTFELQDLAAIAGLARSKGIVTIADNSYCTPLYQQPLALGVDIAVQTATKFIGGHSDLLAGVLCASEERVERIFASDFLNTGAPLSPFNAWLLLRSLRTLALRLDRSSASARSIAGRLENHPRVERLYYPFSASFEQNELAAKQMKQAGCMFTLRLGTNSAGSIARFCESLERFLLAVSWGGHESLAFPVMATLPASGYNHREETHNMVRFYIGLEDPEVLYADIAQALEKL